MEILIWSILPLLVASSICWRVASELLRRFFGETQGAEPEVPHGRESPAAPVRFRVGFASLVRLLVRRLDRFLIPRQGIREFSAREECLLRLSMGRCKRPVRLADGTAVGGGESVGELHWWNEHMPAMNGGRPDLRWARDFQRRLRVTMQELAAHVGGNPAWGEVKGFRGDNSFGGRQGQIGIPELFRRWGFELLPADPPAGLAARFVSFWEAAYILLLFWTYSPNALGRRSIREIKAGEIWISRAVLLAKYGPSPPAE
ncbi:MAG: hypothetical protein M0017_09540 [Desulfobacteraceae bacterium]|nr:hypothetical protein [Desulfobacteraceae bacterium]